MNAIRFEKPESPGALLTNGYTMYQTMLINSQKKSVYFDELSTVEQDLQKLYNEILTCKKYIGLVAQKEQRDTLDQIHHRMSRYYLDNTMMTESFRGLNYFESLIQ